MNHKVLNEIAVVNRTNQLIYYLRAIKPLRRILPANLYEKTDTKKHLGRVVSVFRFLRTFLGKLLYIFIIFGLIGSMFPTVPIEFIWLFFLVLGGCIAPISSDATTEKWTLIRSFKLDYKSYYDYKFRQTMLERILYSVTLLLSIFIFDVNVVTAVIMVLMAFGITMISEGADLIHFRRYHTKIKVLHKVLLLTCLLVVGLGLYATQQLTQTLFIFLGIILFIGGIRMIVASPFKSETLHEAYGLYTLHHANPEETLESVNLKTTQEALRLDDDIRLEESNQVVERNTGYNLLNRLFLERHRRLWFKPLRIRFLIVSGVVSLAVVVLLVMKLFVPDLFIEVSSVLATEIFRSVGPYIFIVYLLNIGESMTRAYYLNCDSKLLNYAFYRRPEIIWKQFVGRLKSLSFLNLIPLIPVVIGAFILVYGNLISVVHREMWMFIGTLVLLSIFFSVHNLLMYYTLQPYNESMQEKGVLYNLMKVVVVMVAYNGNKLSDVPNLNAWLSIITAVYFVIGVICVRLFSEKTFKIRK